jgi:hypothetical protein
LSRDRVPLKKAIAAGNLLQSLLQDLGLAEKLRRYRAWQVWDEVVGPQIAAHARPLRLREGVLEVRVEQAVWMQQLQLMKPQLLARLNECLGGPEIRDIYWRRGRLAPGPPAAETTVKRPPLKDIPLSTEETAAVERVVAEIGDPELRTCLHRLLSRQARLDKVRRDDRTAE